jgi:F420-0:gamma-glutamyl ligase
MIITPIKTKLIKAGDDIKDIIKQSIKKIPENSILVVASKIISTCEDRFVKKIDGTKEEKYNLIRQESELYTDAHSSKYNVMLTIKQNFIFVNAGIDESNANNQYILWPQNPQMSVNKIWTFVKDYYGIKNFGVTMSDSSSFMLNWGVV